MGESFILYTDSLEVLDALTDEQAGLLFRAIYAYQSGDAEKVVDILDSCPTVNVAFVHFRQYFKRNEARYNETSEKRAEAARKRWDNTSNANVCKSMQSDAKACKSMQKHAKRCKDMQSDAYTDTDTDTDIDILKKKTTLTRVKKESAATDVAPTRAQTRYERFLDWLRAECPYIATHYKLPSEELFNKLLDKYGGEAIAEQCANIENRADIRKRYTNLYQTLNNWLKRETNGSNKDDNTEGGREKRAAAVADLITRLRAEDARAG